MAGVRSASPRSRSLAESAPGLDGLAQSHLVGESRSPPHRRSALRAACNWSVSNRVECSAGTREGTCSNPGLLHTFDGFVHGGRRLLVHKRPDAATPTPPPRLARRQHVELQRVPLARSSRPPVRHADPPPRARRECVLSTMTVIAGLPRHGHACVAGQPVGRNAVPWEEGSAGVRRRSSRSRSGPANVVVLPGARRSRRRGHGPPPVRGKRSGAWCRFGAAQEGGGTSRGKDGGATGGGAG